MGKTHKRNDRWKRDRRDQNFKKSKKFKEHQHGISHPTPKTNLPEVTDKDIEINDNFDLS